MTRSPIGSCPVDAVLVELGVIDERDLRDLLADAWLAMAQAQLVEGFDG